MAKDWTDEIPRKYVKYGDGEQVLIKVLKEAPEISDIKIQGKDVRQFTWPVEEDGVERTLDVTSVRLLGKLKALRPLKGRKLAILAVGEGFKRDYEVEALD